MATQGKAVRLAVDIGGTFTDVVVDNQGTKTTTKVLTTTRAPEEGVLRALHSYWRVRVLNLVT